MSLINLGDEIDSEDILFQFDGGDTLKRADSLYFPSRPSSPPAHPERSHPPSYQFSQMQHPHRPLTLLSSDVDFDETMLFDEHGDVHDNKGKGVSQPMLIRRTANHNQHDTFALSLESSFSSGTSLRLDTTDISSPLTSSSADVFSIRTPNSGVEPGQITRDILTPLEGHMPILEGADFADRSSVAYLGKGKAREFTTSSPPVLPPLMFLPTVSTGEDDWSLFVRSSTPGPSSYNSSAAMIYDSPIQTAVHDSKSLENMVNLPSPSEDVTRRLPPRRHSFSNLSIHSARSATARSSPRLKAKVGSPSNIARKLLFRKRADASGSSSGGRVTPSNEVVDTDLPGSPRVGQGSCFLPGCVDLKSMVHDESNPASVSMIDISHVAPLYAQPVFSVEKPTDAAILKAKGRSYSSPFPLASSPLDIISSPEPSVSSPVPVEARDFFDELLPRELKLQILSLFISLYETDFHQLSAKGKWTVLRASSVKNKWVGRDKAIRELIKLRRVSKAWKSLVFDGQLWREVDLSSFPKISPDILSLLSASAGPFITSLNLTGHSRLLPTTLLSAGNDLCLIPAPTDALAHTQLTSLNLQGCSAVSTNSLHQLLMHSPLLETLNVKGLTAVTNTTCNVLSEHCRQLASLNMSRCPNLDGDGIQCMASEALNREDTIPIKELRLSGLKNVTDTVLFLLGKTAPYLEVLDLSYIGSLHNSAIEAFVACSEGDELKSETVLLTAREAGRDIGDNTKYRRRVTRLRHLSLSSCALLTDIAASHLAHAVPLLEHLEMSGIGSELTDDGLVRLFSTTPYIRKVDLEEATEITNSVIQVLTPDVEADSNGAPQPGHALEHLVVSSAMNISNDAFLDLVKKCTRLKILEADGTRLSGPVVKEFVKLSRQREMVDAKIVAIDCRNVGDNVMDITSYIRPRLGWRSYDAKKLAYLDGRDNEELDVGLDECDEKRVVLKTFYSWQIVDLVKSARDKRQKAKKGSGKTAISQALDDLQVSTDRRWWSPRGRRPAGANTPTSLDVNSQREGCIIM